MYDFFLGNREEIDLNPQKYLLAIKRMLPRWCNSIPDSEYLAIYDTLAEISLPEGCVLVETGSGASTIVLCYFALKHSGELYTWDTNGSKLAYVRSILNDTLMKYFNNHNLNNHWKYVAFESTSDFVGIPMLSEMNKTVSACFLDSEHTLKVLMSEIRALKPLLTEGALVAIDDGNYRYKSYNTSYINMIRKKHNLTAIEDSSDNIGNFFWKEVEGFLRSNFTKVIHLNDSYKSNYISDIFWSYYKTDREIMAGLMMEKTDDLDHRFDAWRVWRVGQ